MVKLAVSYTAADVDDAALSSLQEGNEDVGEMEWASEVDIHEVIIILREGGLNITVKNKPSAVDENVQSTESLDDRTSHFLHVNCKSLTYCWTSIPKSHWMTSA